MSEDKPIDGPIDNLAPPDGNEQIKRDNLLAIPGQDDDEGPHYDRSLNKWHNFESQYSLALEQSAVIEREHWGNQIEFLMSCVASAVGLGNIWRFPFIAGQNGGGAFLFPYLIVLTLIGRPLYLLELGLGQFTSSGTVKIWELAPGFRGVGYGATVASFFLTTFYCVIMGWSILYFIYSFWPVLPWTSNGTWAAPLQDEFSIKLLKEKAHADVGAKMTQEEIFFVFGHLGNPIPRKFGVSKSDFELGKGLDGPPQVTLSLSLLVAWILVWAVMVGGVSGSGKVAYFTALFPYVVLIILLAGGCSLPGALDGIEYFFYPKFETWLEGKTWFQAIGQCFFSLGITFGGLFMFSSFNRFHHKLGRDILVISIMDTFTSLLAGTCLFALIGNLANSTKQNVSDIAGEGGAGMAFITFPAVLQAFSPYPGPNIFSFFFFFMIIVLAVGSANGLVGTCVTVICDLFPKWDRRYVVSGFCAFCFFLGLIYCCPTGGNVIDIVDKHGSEMAVYVLAIFEVIGIIYVYGLQNISNDFEFMLGHKINLYWKISWAILPLLLTAILCFYFATYERNKGWPNSAVACAWTITVLSWLILPITLIVVICTRKSSSWTKRMKASMYPTRKWGPKDPAIREAWRHWKKTQPSETPAYTYILQSLRMRSPQTVVGPQDYWANELESQYQTTVNTAFPSTAAVFDVPEVKIEVDEPAPESN